MMIFATIIKVYAIVCAVCFVLFILGSISMLHEAKQNGYRIKESNTNFIKKVLTWFVCLVVFAVPIVNIALAGLIVIAAVAGINTENEVIGVFWDSYLRAFI